MLKGIPQKKVLEYFFLNFPYGYMPTNKNMPANTTF